MEEVVNLFKENDLAALKKMYEITNDKLIKILISWYNEFEEIEERAETNEFYMYNDIMKYICEEYGLNKKK